MSAVRVAAGECDLGRLLAAMAPTLDAETYVFATVDDPGAARGLPARLLVEEREGTTVVVAREVAVNRALPHAFPCRCITLNVHSALDAVGLLARVTTELAGHGVAVNAVAGYHHDHLFVPDDRADEALEILRRLTRTAAGPADV